MQRISSITTLITVQLHNILSLHPEHIRPPTLHQLSSTQETGYRTMSHLAATIHSFQSKMKTSFSNNERDIGVSNSNLV